MRQLASRLVYENPWMRVREDDIERADGSVGIYGVVEKDDFALIIPFQDGAFWLVEQYRYPVEGRYWEFPQGSWREGEDGSPEELARSELHEETGLDASTMTRIGYLYGAYGYADQGFHVFLATDLEPGTPDRDPEEQDMRVDRVTVEAFEGMIRSGAVRDAPTVAAYSLFNLSR